MWFCIQLTFKMADMTPGGYQVWPEHSISISININNPTPPFFLDSILQKIIC